MSSDLTKYVYKEDENSNVFFIDTEDYTDTYQHLQGYEDGDIVKWSWRDRKYIGTLRCYGSSKNGVFVITDAKNL